MPFGKTYLYDSLNKAVNICGRHNNYKNRQFVICLTDGEDSGSEMSWSRIKERLTQSGVTLIIIGIGIDQEKE